MITDVVGFLSGGGYKLGGSAREESSPVTGQGWLARGFPEGFRWPRDDPFNLFCGATVVSRQQDHGFTANVIVIMRIKSKDGLCHC